jgi:hypothetical protein
MPKKKRGSKPKQESNDDGYPKVSVLTPLYNRNKWLPLMMANICHFNYDKKKIEWFILDSKDGDEDVRLFKNETEVEMVRNVIRPIKLKYVYINPEDRDWETRINHSIFFLS